MKTYPEDNYDTYKYQYEGSGFPEDYSSQYCRWLADLIKKLKIKYNGNIKDNDQYCKTLENIVIKLLMFLTDHVEDDDNKIPYCKILENVVVELLTKNKNLEYLDFRNEILTLHIGGVDYSIILYNRIVDKKIRDENPLLKYYPICLADSEPVGNEEIRAVNEWEIQTVAKLAEETLEETGYEVSSNDYKKLLKKLEPYKSYFLDETWRRLSELTVSEFLSVRIDKNIPWSEMADHPENIVYDLEILVWADKKDERFLDINTDLSQPMFQFMRNQG